MSAWLPPLDDRQVFARRLREYASIGTKTELYERAESFLLQLQGFGFELFAYWYDLVIPVLSETLREAVAGDPGVAEDAPIDVARDPLDAQIGIWNIVGDVAIRNRQTHLAQDLFAALLRELRTFQESRGRVHKGTPYHQIGVSLLAAGDQVEARQYFVFAAIEDLITFGLSDQALASPAAQTLQALYGFEDQHFQGLFETVDAMRSSDTAEDRLKLQNPELLYLEPSRAAEVGE